MMKEAKQPFQRHAAELSLNREAQWMRGSSRVQANLPTKRTPDQNWSSTTMTGLSYQLQQPNTTTVHARVEGNGSRMNIHPTTEGSRANLPHPIPSESNAPRAGVGASETASSFNTSHQVLEQGALQRPRYGRSSALGRGGAATGNPNMPSFQGTTKIGPWGPRFDQGHQTTASGYGHIHKHFHSTQSRGPNRHHGQAPYCNPMISVRKQANINNSVCSISPTLHSTPTMGKSGEPQVLTLVNDTSDLRGPGAETVHEAEHRGTNEPFGDTAPVSEHADMGAEGSSQQTFECMEDDIPNTFADLYDAIIQSRASSLEERCMEFPLMYTESGFEDPDLS
ncbi:hypothetical protein GGR57DRAFT_439842 [Xylariaceae sp. FL1272]|nr:hypothetical protein GGR57DRAFT_439842 [Xylariaceae sp. FL1272]